MRLKQFSSLPGMPNKRAACMHVWASFPLLRYLLWLLAGLLAAMYLPLEGSWFLWALAASASLYILSFILRKGLVFFPLLQGVLAFVFLFSLGFLRMQERQAGVQLSFSPETTGYYLVEARAEAQATPKTIKVPVRLLASRSSEDWQKAEGKLMLYIRKDSLRKVPAYGDRLLVKMAPAEIPGPLNSNTFNYKAYMETQGICCQAFVLPTDVYWLREGRADLRGLALNIRKWASAQLARHLEGAQEEAIANALLLGYREQLDEEINQAYATAGAMHVLAVSGLHVGFLYLFLRLLFHPWRRQPLLKWLGFACSLLVLWSYAFITGLSPSVLRAVSMFSFIAFAVQLKRHSGIYNALAMAAFILLLYDPLMLRAVGFQLSFLAVFGIVYLQPRFARWYAGRHWILRKAGDLLTVSLAAQLATFPLGLYYFGQFPTYFFLTNLLVVPAASLMLGLGFLFLLSSLISEPLAAAVGFLLEGIIKLVNGAVFTAEWLPFSSIAISLTATQLALLLLFILALILLMQDKKFYEALLTAALGLGLLTSFFFQTYTQKQQRRLLLFHMPGYSALQLVEGRADFLYAPFELPGQQLKHTIRPGRVALGLASGLELKAPNGINPPIVQQEGYDLLVWRGYSLAYVYKPLPEPCLFQEPLPVDFVVVAANAVKELEVLRCYFKVGKLLIDGSNQIYVQKKLQQEAEILNLPYHLTAEAGAFELNL